MQHFLMRFWSGLSSRTTFLVWVLTSATATLMGPFGTFDGISLVPRAAFWFGILGASIFIGLALRATIRMFLPRLSDWPETLLFATLLMCVFTPILHAVVSALSDGQSGMSFAEMGLVVFVVPLVVAALRHILAVPRPDLLRASMPKPRILQRLPDECGRRILRISVRDHYVEIVTDRTREKLLMRFSDAMAEAEGIPGLQVHRSHWVAEDAVRAVETDKGRMYLSLEDGSRVPVSRGFRDAVREAGIGDDAAA